MADESGAERVSIRKLCGSWRLAATQAGGIAIGGESEQFRLHRNGVRFHELSYDETREAVVGLTEILLLPGMNTIVDLDHSLLWSWLGELLAGPDGPLSMHADPQVSRLAEVTLRTALANVRPPSREASLLLDSNSRQMLEGAHSILPYLAFPLMEAVARRACSAYVGLGGIVAQPFPRRGGGVRYYKIGARCSNVADLLSHFVGSVADADLAADLLDLLKHVAALESVDHKDPADGYAVLFDWRNSSAHGEVSLTTIGGTVLSIALLIALDGIRDEYTQRRDAALERARRECETAEFTGRWQPSPRSYYPPFPWPGS